MNWVCSPSIFGSYPTRCRHNKFTTTCWWVTCRCFTRGLCLSSIGIALRTLGALRALGTLSALFFIFLYFFLFLLLSFLLCDTFFLFFRLTFRLFFCQQFEICLFFFS